MTTVLGRRVILTTLEPIPPLFRTAPGVLALNRPELDAVSRNATADAPIPGAVRSLLPATLITR